MSDPTPDLTLVQPTTTPAVELFEAHAAREYEEMELRLRLAQATTSSVLRARIKNERER